uniref:Uncharacterized protein n=1 Tax=viral metagenome TaxID=1070528 RepID=A0A6H1ZHU0_9ZZZZ
MADITYDQLITDICSQLGDPDKGTFDDADQYKSRAKTHLQAAISQLVGSKQYTLSEISYYVKQFTLPLSTTAYSVANKKIADIISIIPKYDVTYATNPWFIKLFKLDDPQLGGIYSNKEQQPTDEDVFVIWYGDSIQAIINVTSSNFTAPTNVYMFYVEDPDILSGYSGSASPLTYFKMSFIQRAKLLAIQTIKQEDELSN